MNATNEVTEQKLVKKWHTTMDYYVKEQGKIVSSVIEVPMEQLQTLIQENVITCQTEAKVVTGYLNVLVPAAKKKTIFDFLTFVQTLSSVHFQFSWYQSEEEDHFFFHWQQRNHQEEYYQLGDQLVELTGLFGSDLSLKSMESPSLHQQLLDFIVEWVKRGTLDISELKQFHDRFLDPEEQQDPVMIQKTQALYQQFMQLLKSSIQGQIAYSLEEIQQLIAQYGVSFPSVAKTMKKSLALTIESTQYFHDLSCSVPQKAELQKINKKG